jgi:hypothetical protein
MDKNEQNGYEKSLLQSMLKFLLADIKLARTPEAIAHLTELANNWFAGDSAAKTVLKKALDDQQEVIKELKQKEKAKTESEKSDTDKFLEELEEYRQKKSVQLTIGVCDQTVDKAKKGSFLRTSDLRHEEQAALIVELSNPENHKKVKNDLARLDEIEKELNAKKERNPSEAVDVAKKLERLEECRKHHKKLNVIHEAAEPVRGRLQGRDHAQCLPTLDGILGEAGTKLLALEQLQAAPSRTVVAKLAKAGEANEHAEKNKPDQAEKTAPSPAKKSSHMDEPEIEPNSPFSDPSPSELGKLTPPPTPPRPQSHGGRKR